MFCRFDIVSLIRLRRFGHYFGFCLPHNASSLPGNYIAMMFLFPIGKNNAVTKISLILTVLYIYQIRTV